MANLFSYLQLVTTVELLLKVAELTATIGLLLTTLVLVPTICTSIVVLRAWTTTAATMGDRFVLSELRCLNIINILYKYGRNNN
jgi:hypothetical protein